MSPTKIPKPVQDVKAYMASIGQPITADNLGKYLDKKLMNNISNTMRNSLSLENKAAYKDTATTDQSRRDWVAQFVLDPAMAKTTGFNRCVAFKKENHKDKEVWITKCQMEGPEYCNNAEHAKLLIEEGGMPSRPHEEPCLAKAGVMQYLWVKKSVQRSHGATEEAGTVAEAAVNAEDYKEVANQIKAGVGKPVKRKASKPPKEPESEESKRLKASASLRTSTIRKCKAALDKAAQDAALCEKLVADLGTKGYPAALNQFFEMKIADFRGDIKITQDKYAEEAMKVQERSPSIESVQAGCHNVDMALQSLDSKHKAFKDSALSDLKKLVG